MFESSRLKKVIVLIALVLTHFPVSGEAQFQDYEQCFMLYDAKPAALTPDEMPGLFWAIEEAGTYNTGTLLLMNGQSCTPELLERWIANPDYAISGNTYTREYSVLIPNTTPYAFKTYYKFYRKIERLK